MHRKSTTTTTARPSRTARTAPTIELPPKDGLIPVVAYMRMSDPSQDDSIEQQRPILRALEAAFGYRIIRGGIVKSCVWRILRRLKGSRLRRTRSVAS
jgi:hypothetical protein